MRVGGGGQPLKIKNRLSHHEVVCSKQFWRIAYVETSETNGSKRAVQLLNAARYLPAYPVFGKEKLNRSDQKSVKRKIGPFSIITYPTKL